MDLLFLVFYILVAFIPATLSHNDKFEPFEIPEWNYTGHVAGQVYHDVPREYHMIFPIDYDPTRTEPYPLIVMLHGSGGDAAAFAVQTPILTEKAPIAGYFLVFPEGVQVPGSKLRCQERTWNSGVCCGEAFINRVDDVGFISLMLDDLLRRFPNVDDQRMFATGSSNGGSMTLRLGCELPFRFAAVAPQIASYEGVNGTTCGTNCGPIIDGYETCDWDVHSSQCNLKHDRLPEIYSCDLRQHPVPMLFLNGRLDALSNISGFVQRPEGMSDDDFPMSFPPMKLALEYLRLHSGCPAHEKQVTSFRNGTKGNSTHCITYESGVGCNVNLTYCLADAGHRWFGSSYDGYAVCRWEGYDEFDCQWEYDQELYGSNTLSISVADEVLAFFDNVGQTVLDSNQENQTPKRYQEPNENANENGNGNGNGNGEPLVVEAS